MPISQQDLDTQTAKLAKLIKSEIGGLRSGFKSDLNKEVGGLRSEIKSDLNKEIGGLRSEMKTEIGGLRSDMEKRFKFQEKQLLSHIDDKFETNRRKLVNEMQNFQDAIITEVKNIKQETIVNSSHRQILTDHEKRITKVEKAVFSN